MEKRRINIFKRIALKFGSLSKALAVNLIVCWVRLRALFFGPPRFLPYDKSANEKILRAFGATVGKNVRLHGPITIHGAEKGYSNLFIGDGVMVNGNTYFDLNGKIILKNGSSIGPGVIINTHNRFNYNEFLENVLSEQCGVGDVVVGEGSGIKANALVIMGVTIGKNSVIAGGAVVNRDIPDYSFAAGIPAVVKRNLLPEESSEKAAMNKE